MDEFPNELLAHIFSYLFLDDLFNMRIMCKQIQIVANNIIGRYIPENDKEDEKLYLFALCLSVQEIIN